MSITSSRDRALFASCTLAPLVWRSGGATRGFDFDAARSEAEVPHFVRVRHSTRLEHVDLADAVSALQLRGHEDPRVHERRDQGFGLFQRLLRGGEAGE